MAPYEPRRGPLRALIGWLNLGRETNWPSDEESRKRQAEKRHRRRVRAAQRRLPHGRQTR